MHIKSIIKLCTLTSGLLLSTLVLLSGCQSSPRCCCATPKASATNPDAKPDAASAATNRPPAAAPTLPPSVGRQPIRIKAGVAAPVTDSAGQVWLADQGFQGGEVMERPDLEIANTKDPVIYRAERYSMESFSWKIPSGKYQVKLHFAETFEGITGPGQRVFSFVVQGREFKDFDVWQKAGGPLRAYVETVPVDVTDGQLTIKFVSNIENPEINGIEIIPVR